MKKSKQYLITARELSINEDNEFNDALLKLICYSPKFPVRLNQQNLLNDAESFSISVFDEHFSKSELKVQGYKWGNGPKKILLTHGWGSKAADFTELIILLKEKNTEIIAFDAPGNGASEGELSNLILYTKSVAAIVQKFGIPDILIGHSLGAMANINFLKESNLIIPLLISITPLIKLKEHFKLMMTAANASEAAQHNFFSGFKKLFKIDVEYFDSGSLYSSKHAENHYLYFETEDKLSPLEYMEEFLQLNPTIKSSKHTGIGHEKMHRDPEVLAEICNLLT
ncbi:MAG: alpha/beta fold hydrolase [Sphingobacteriales bacterium]|nr:alpha/beta fold hydrolase [Sphingobacteriales bacterium]